MSENVAIKKTKRGGGKLKTHKELIDEVSNMTEKEILRHEMEMLLISSKASSEKEIPEIAMAMVEVYDRLIPLERFAPDIKVSVPEGRNLSVCEIADAIRKMFMGQMQTISKDISLSEEELKTLRDGASKRYLCESAEKMEDEKENLAKAHTCISYHIQAYQQQHLRGEKADITEACKHCIYNHECDFAWSGYILSAIPETKYHFTLAEECQYLTERGNESL